jgi:hypothetical protein
MNTLSPNNKTILYRNGRGGISRWCIWQEPNSSNQITLHWSSESKIGDTPIYWSEIIFQGKGGRSLKQQADLRFIARIRGKVDNGYVYDIEEAKKPLTGGLGYYKPMLAVKYRDVKAKLNLNKCYVQPKLDGHRCLIRNDANELTAYSRAGRLINTIEHIKKELVIPDGVTLDGEIYTHGAKLQVISSWAKRLQADSKKLNYVVYDIIDDSMDYGDRYGLLQEIQDRNPHIILCPSWKISEIEDFNIAEFLHEHIHTHGYEGLMLRTETGPYEIGRRSKYLIKVKALDDAEAVVVGVTASKDGWAVLHCKMPSGQIFKLSAPGTVPEKRYVLENIEKFIGKEVTYEFAQLTNEGKPFHATALRWREDL